MILLRRTDTSIYHNLSLLSHSSYRAQNVVSHVERFGCIWCHNATWNRQRVKPLLNARMPHCVLGWSICLGKPTCCQGCIPHDVEDKSLLENQEHLPGTWVSFTLPEDEGVDDDVSRSHYEKNSTGFEARPFDARNTFREWNWYQMLHIMAHCHPWNEGKRFAMNRYHLFSIVYVRDEPGEPPIILLCKDGIPHECGFSVYTYLWGGSHASVWENERSSTSRSIHPPFDWMSINKGKWQNSWPIYSLYQLKQQIQGLQ